MSQSSDFKSLAARQRVTAWLHIFLGCLLGAAAYPMFLTPNHIAPGGLTGLGTVFNYLFGWQVGIVALVMNVPLFLWGWRSMGKVFVFRSAVATVLFTACIDLLPLKPMTDDPLLASLFGGVLLGMGLGMILRGGATSGGTDMAARMIHKRLQHITVGGILFAIDCISVIAAGVSIEVEYGLYAFICIFVSDRVLDFVMLGVSRRRACYIISERYEEIYSEILLQMERGVTILQAKGAYSGTERPMLLCLLGAQEVAQLKNIVCKYDESAFVFITEAHDVLGEGFSSLSNSD